MKIAIIGGGIAGLTAAYRICKQGGNPIVIEKNPELGGLTSSLKINGYFIEEFYHHVFKGDNFLFKLLGELGIEDKLTWHKTKSGSVDLNGVYELTSPLDLIRYKPLNFLEKFRLGMFVLKIKRIKNFENYDSINAKDWIIKNTGEVVFDKFFEPILRGKYGNFADEISAAWFISRITLRSDRSLSGESLGYMKGGFHVLIDTLAREILSMGGGIITDAKVERIDVSDKGKKVAYTKDGKNFIVECDAIISTIPISTLLKICGCFKDDEAHDFAKIKYEGSVCVLLGLRRKLSDIYWLNVLDRNCPFAAIIEHTNFQVPDSYGGDRIVYLISYTDKESPLFNEPDREILSKYVGYLKKFFNISESDIEWFKVVKNKSTAPVYSLNYIKIRPEYETKTNGLFIAGLPISYPERSINDSVKTGITVAEMVMKR